VRFKNFIDQKDLLLQTVLSQEELQLDYTDLLDGIIDFKAREMILEGIKDENFEEDKLISEINTHIEKYNNCTPICLLDCHDTNRILYECRQDIEKFKAVLHALFSLKTAISIYYGTEKLISNKKDIDRDEPYADVDVRPPFDSVHPNKEIEAYIQKLIEERKAKF
jgi:glycosidase